jgi:hypothetical protein
VNPSNTVQARNRLIGRILEERNVVLGDIGVSPRGVRVPSTWQSVTLGDAASVRPAAPELYQR